MDRDEVKACIRALLSSSSISYTFKTLLRDFKATSGCDLPLFEFANALEFLRSLTDTIQLCGDLRNPKVCLIESKKSSHITSLVDRQKSKKLKQHDFGLRRIIIPNNEINNLSLENRKSFENSAINQSKSPKSNSHNSVTDSNIKNNSTINSSTVLRQNDKNTLNSIPPKVNSCEDKSLGKINTSQDKSWDEVCLFEDISDAESCYSTGEDSSTRSSSCQPLNYVNDGMKNKLKKLIKEFPDGLWCCDLPDRFQDMHDLVLDYREFGYTSLIQMLSELPDVFRCVRPGNEDWIVFDASMPPSAEEKKIIHFKLNATLASEIKSNLQKLLFTSCEISSNLGVEMDDIPSLYKKMFDRDLDFQSLGFDNLKSFLSSLEGSLLNIYNMNKKLIVVPMFNHAVNNPFKWKEALPPITAENDIFYEIFPQDVVGPEESFFELDLNRHIAIGQTVEVCVAEVWSPSKFYVQLNKFKDRLNRFMDDLQNFYNVYMNKYKMPDVTIRPKQVCVGLYNSDPEFPEEWHRAEILKVINETTVSINFVDYGTVTSLKKSQLRFMHRRFWSFPVQAFLASLAGVSPVCGGNQWPVPVSKRFLQFLRGPFLRAEMTDIDFKKPSMNVILYDPFQNPVSNVNLRLVNEKLARADGFLIKNQPENFGEFDIPSLENNVPRPVQTVKDLKVVPDSKNTPSEKPVENTKVKFNFEFDEGLDFIGKETAAKNKFEIKKDSSKISPAASHQFNRYSHETTPNLLSKSERLPPGIRLSPPLMDFTQVPFFMFEQQQNELKKKTNLLAIELLSTNFSIKQVALTNLELALKIATEMAETYVYSLFPSPFSMCYVNDCNPVMLKGDLTSPSPAVFNTIESENIVTTALTSGDGTNNPPAPEKSLDVPEEIILPEALTPPPNSVTATNGTIITIENNTDITGTTITTDSSISANNTIATNKTKTQDCNTDSSNTSTTITTDSSTSANNTIATNKTKTQDCNTDSTNTSTNITTDSSTSANDTIATNKTKTQDCNTDSTNTSTTITTDSSTSANNATATSKTKTQDCNTDSTKTSTTITTDSSTIANNTSETKTQDCNTDSTNTSTTITTDSSTSANNTIPSNKTKTQDCNTDSTKTSTTITTDSSTSANNTIATSRTKTQDCVVKVELVELGGKNVHLVKLENKKYFCVEEILRSFTAISNRETADRVFKAKRMNFQYKILTRKTDEEILKTFKRDEMLQVLKKKRNKKVEVYLLDAKNIVSYLKALGCFIEITEEIEDLLENSSPSDTQTDRKKKKF